jgi:hypothetical protein
MLSEAFVNESLTGFSGVEATALFLTGAADFFSSGVAISWKPAPLLKRQMGSKNQCVNIPKLSYIGCYGDEC